MIAGRHNPLGRQGLPYAYQVEYLEATGTQWIHPQAGQLSLGTRIEFDCEMASAVQFLGANSGSNEVFFSYANGLHFLGGIFAATAVVNTPCSVVMDLAMTTANLVMEINGAVVRNISGKANNGNILLFAVPQLQAGGDGMQSLVFSKGKYKSFKVYRNHAIVRDLIPVVDGKGSAGMYDKVSGEIFYNQGTGEFTVGPRI